MFKKLFLALLILYIIGTGAYFLTKYVPSIKQYFVKSQPSVVEQKQEVKKPESTCPSFAMGHIAGEDFRVNTRVLSSSKLVPIDEKDILGWISKHSCDRAGQQALIYYNSRPVAVADIRSYDYSKPLGESSGQRPILYTVLKTQKRAAIIPSNGYVVAVFDYDQKNIDFYDRVETEMTPEDEELIAGSADTIYYEIVGKDPAKIEIEYSGLKTDLDTNGDKLMSIVSTWNDPKMPSSVKYLAIFNIHKYASKSGSKRYQLFPINKVRKSNFHIDQVIDVDNDGYKETIIRKERDSNDSFTLFDYDPAKDIYTEQILSY